MKKISFSLFSLLIAFFIPSLALAQMTLIPDPAFEQALIDLGHDSGIPDGMVPTANIDTLSRLDLPEEGTISDLTGIEDFLGLTYLDCNTNNISSLNISQNTALEYLIAAVNEISSIDLSKAPNLTVLNLIGNPIDSLDISQNAALKELGVGGTGLIKELDVSQNTQLSHLQINASQISELDLSQNPLLEYLAVRSDNLSSLDLTKNVGLQNVLIRNTQLETLDLSKNTQITQLILNENKLLSLDLRELAALLELRINQNQITQLDLSKNTALVRLSCELNQLTNLDLSANPQLLSLRCSRNQISRLDLSSNPVIEYIDCHSNELTCLMVSNGNNMAIVSFIAFNNPTLNCIEVDDPEFSINNWTDVDPLVSWSKNCSIFCTIGTKDYAQHFPNLQLYPNPTEGAITIDLGEVKSDLQVSVWNPTGQLLQQEEFGNQEQLTMSLAAFPQGMYFLLLRAEDGATRMVKVLKTNN